MPKKPKKSTAEKEEVTLEEIVTITHLRKQKAERDMLHERRMARDLTRLLSSWQKDKLPKSVVVGDSQQLTWSILSLIATHQRKQTIY